MEGAVQDPGGDRGNELRTETGTRHRQASGAAARKGMFCRSMQADRLQHKEMGESPLCLVEAIARLRWFYLPYLEAVLGRCEQNGVFSENIMCPMDLTIGTAQKRGLVLRNHRSSKSPKRGGLSSICEHAAVRAHRNCPVRYYSSLPILASGCHITSHCFLPFDNSGVDGC